MLRIEAGIRRAVVNRPVEYFGILLLLAFVGLFVFDRWLKNTKAEAKRKAEEAAFQQRWEYLRSRFGDAASRVLSKTLLQGDTTEFVKEAFGAPVDVQEKVHKSKVTHTFCYQPQGKNRYGFRVKLENGLVVGWESK